MDKKIVNEINLKGEVCPMTFVKTRLALEKVDYGERIKVIFDSKEAETNVPKSLGELNHKIIQIDKLDRKNFYIIIEK